MATEHPKRNTAVVLAIIGLLAAAVPGVLSILELVIDRTLPERAEATGDEFEDSEIFRDTETGTFFVLDGDEEIPVYQQPDDTWEPRPAPKGWRDPGQQQIEQQPAYPPLEVK